LPAVADEVRARRTPRSLREGRRSSADIVALLHSLDDRADKPRRSKLEYFRMISPDAPSRSTLNLTYAVRHARWTEIKPLTKPL